MKTYLSLLLSITFIAGCSTSERQFATPVGMRTGGEVGGPLEVLGVASFEVPSKNQKDAMVPFQHFETINVAVGTVVVVPCVAGWDIGYGHTDPDDYSQLPDGAQFTIHTHQRPLTFARFGVECTEVHAPDFTTTPPTQTAVIKVGLGIMDENQDDPWFSDLRYKLIFLGHGTNAPSH